MAITEQKTRSKKKSSVKFFILAAFIVAAIVAMRLLEVDEYLSSAELRSWMDGLGIWGPIIYILIYATAPSLMAPGLPITVMGGILFGPVMGVVYASLGATIGASIAFQIARHMGRGWVESKVKGSRLAELDRRVDKDGWKVVAFTRLIPLFPFNALNYAFGLTNIRFRTYLIGSFIFMLPGVTAYVFFSSSIFDLFTGGAVSRELLIGIILIVALSLIPIIYKIRKKRAEGHKKLDQRP